MADEKQEINNGSSQSRVVLAKPRLGGFGSASFGASSSSKSCNTFGSVLRPPQLEPIINPFMKVTEAHDVEKENASNTASNDVRLKDVKSDVEAPKFVPLGTGNVASRSNNPIPSPAQPTTSASSAGFVFGQNLSERVVMKENINNGEANSVDHSSTNGSSELLFTNAAVSAKENTQDELGPGEGSSSGDGLAAAAAEYERSHARPPPPTTNCTMTGEEGEINVLQISCRMFAWEAGSWRERGRGVLRLNDAPPSSGRAARLVARVSGSLRVVLNTKLWPGMIVEKAGTKSLRITTMDAQQQVKLFLIMGAPSDIDLLHTNLTARVTGSKQRTCSSNTTSQQAAERLEANTDDSEYLDKPDYTQVYESAYEVKTHSDTEHDTDNKCSADDRLEASTDLKTDGERESNVDNMDEDKDTKSLKRKEPIDDETPPKRQCADISIQ